MKDFETNRLKRSGLSPTVALNAKGIEMKEKGIDILSFAAGEPDFDTPESIKEAAVQAIRNNQTHYTSAAGIVTLRRAIARKLREENGIDTDENGIIVTPGAKLALFQALLAFLEEGDECLVPTPAYPSYRAIIQMTGATYIPVPLKIEDGFHLTREMLEEKTTDRTKMLIICNPCNPTGHVLTQQEVEDITAFAEAHEILVISDEIYEKINLIRSHGRFEGGADYFSSAGLFDYVELGFNWRMSNLTATLGITQIEKADKIIELRQKNVEYLTTRLLEETDEITVPEVPKGYNHVYQLFSIFANRRDELIDYLGDNGVSSKIYFHPVHQSEFYRNKLKYDVDLPVTESIFEKTITLPMFPSMTTEQMDYVAETIGKFYKS